MIDFSIEPSKTALLIIDMQNVFVEGSPVSAPEGPQVLERLNHLAGVCHEVGIQVIYTAHVVRPDHSNIGILGKVIPPVQEGLIDDGSTSARLHTGVQVREGDIVLKKPRYGAFHGTDLELLLRQKGIDTLIIGGIATNVCPETTAREAMVRDFKVLFLSDGTATFGLPDLGFGPVTAQEVQRVTCSVLGFFFGQVLSVDQVLQKLRHASHPLNRSRKQMVNVKRILIVGAGIAGLSLATALQKQNFVVEVVERSPTWSITGAGITLPANGVRVLRALGLGDAVERDGAIIRQWGFFDQQGELLCNTDLEALWGDVGPCLCIARPRLHQALLGDASAVPIRLGISVTSLLQNSESVSVGFSNGSSGEYDLVVGADGVHSTIRSLAISPVPPIYAGQLIWRSITPTCPQGLTNMMVFLGNQRSFFGLLPLGNGSAYGFGGVIDERGFDDPVEGRLERFRTRFAGFGGPVPEFVASLTHDRQLHFGPTERVELEHWHTGRILLIGDAAHASQPMMSEGGCMAMEDALVLAEVLSTEDTLAGALQTYVSRRRPRTEWVQQQSQAAAEGWALPPASRNATLRERGDQLMWQRYQLLRPIP